MLIHGSCHCRNIEFTLNWRPEPQEIPARACTCSFCRKHAGVWTSCPAGTLNVAIKNSRHVTRYAFGTQTAQFYACSHCGVVPVAISTIDEHRYAVVNVNTFDDIAASMLRHAPARFDGEAQDARLERRKRYWIADVTVSAAGE